MTRLNKEFETYLITSIFLQHEPRTNEKEKQKKGS